MINLLPKTGEVHVKGLYRYSFLALFSLLLGLVALAAVCMLVPSYVLLKSQIRAYEATSLAIKEEQADVVALTAEIKAANQLSSEIAQYHNELNFNETIDLIRSIAGVRVSIDSISYEAVVGESPQFVVSGTALTRNDLTSFSARLTEDEQFEKADVPIENLAGDRDVSFTIIVVAAVAE